MGSRIADPGFFMANTNPFDGPIRPLSIRSFAFVTSFAVFFMVWPEIHAAPTALREREVFGWRLLKQERSGDGAYVSTFRLEGIAEQGARGTQDAAATLEIVYRAAPREGRGRAGRIYALPEFYRGRIETGASIFSLRSGRSEQIELWARLRRGDAIHYAQTLFAAFGQSGQGHENAERLDSPPDWPAFSLSNVETFYRAQTGVELFFRIRPVPAAVCVFENGLPVSRPPVNGEGLYRYTSPHEAELSSAGYSAKKDLLIVADLPNGRDRISFYLPVFRAFYGQTDLTGGLSVLLAGTALSWMLVWLWNRRFRWRCN
jgi:hypothetical protein